MIRLPAFCALLLALAQLASAEEAFPFAEYQGAPVHIHLLRSAAVPALATTLTETDIERIFGKVNRVWSAAGLGFYIASIDFEEAAPGEDGSDSPTLEWLLPHIPPDSYRASQFNVYYIKQFQVNGVFFPKAIFVKDTASLRRVAGGIDEPIPRVTSHELGHALGLSHRQDTFNLMASGTTGTSLNAAEIAQVRQRLSALGRFRPAPELLSEAERLLKEGHTAEARRLQRWLAALPLENDALAHLRQEIAHAGQ